ncbi:MAG: hypothetical protein AAF416_07855 [Pseudomonadota bacterium]
MNDDLASAQPVPTAEDVRALFTRSDGTYRFARWGRPLVPAFFGMAEPVEAVWTEALKAVASMCGLEIAEEDPELSSNFLVFIVNRWDELRSVPSMFKLIPDLERLLGVLAASGANQYRIYGFAPGAEGKPAAIRICVTLIRRDEEIGRGNEGGLALGQCVQGLLLWSDHAFTSESPVAEIAGVGRAMVKPRYLQVIRAAYAPELPDATDDPSHAERIVAVAGDAAGAA